MAVGDRVERAGPSLPGIVYLYLTIVVLSWSLNWPLMKLAIADIPPPLFVLSRLIGSLGLILVPLVARRQNLLPEPGERWDLFWVGQAQVAGFLILSIVGLSIVPAGRAIVLAYTMPLWAIPIGLFMWPEPIGRKTLFGAALGFAGLVLFMNPGLVDWRDPRLLAGNAALLLAAIAWALGACLYRRRAWRSPFWVQTGWQVAVSIPPVAVLVLSGWDAGSIHWTARAVAIVIYNAVVTTTLGYFLWSKILSVMPAATAGQVMTLTPIGGFILSTWLFGGAITTDVVLSIVLIVAGIFVTLRR
ncbi:MAG: DMT family transporter [Stellaceae bacterium]